MQQNRVRVIFEAVLNNFKNNVKQAAQATLQVGEAGKKASSQVNFKDSIESARNLKDEIFSVKNVIGGLLTALAGKKVLDFTIGAAFDEEKVKMQYEVLLKSADAAEKRFKEVYKMGADTPYENQELLQADKILTGFNIRTMDMLTLMGDVGAAMEDPKQAIVELSKYMGQISAGQTGLALARFEELGIVTRKQLRDMGLEFDKANSYVGNTKDLFEAIIQVMEGKYSGMMDKLAGTGSGLIATLQDTIGEIGRSIGNQALDQAKGSMEGFLEAIERAEKSGSLDRLTTTLGGFLAMLFDKLTDGINNLDEIIDWVSNFASGVERNFDKITWAVKNFLTVWVTWKLSMGVGSIITTLGSGVLTLVKAYRDYKKITEGATVAQWALNGAMAANPIGAIIFVVSLLIMGLIKLSGEFDSLRDFGLYCLEALKLGFLYFGQMVWVVITKILELFESLFGNIPLIGDAVKKMADVSRQALQGFKDEISNTKGHMEDLRREASEPIILRVGVDYDLPDESNYPSLEARAKADALEKEAGKLSKQAEKMKTGKEKDNVLAKARSLIDQANKIRDESIKNNSGSGKTYASVDGITPEKSSREKKKKEITIHDRINDTKDIYKDQIDMYESRADLAEVQKDKKNEKLNKNHMLYLMQQQAKQLLNLQSKVTGKDKNIVETARNRLLSEIVKLTEDIKGAIDELVGDFNVPSDLKALTEYQYKVQKADSKLTKQFIVSPDVSMYLTIADTDGKGAKQIRDEIKSFTQVIFDKNELVSTFMQDVTRN